MTPCPSWRVDYGLIECREPGYAARRRRHIADADTMVLIGDLGATGLIAEFLRIATRDREIKAPEIGERTGQFLVGASRLTVQR